MPTNIRQGFVTGSGAVVDVASSVTVANTRVRSLNASGVGTFLITGTSTDEFGTIKGNNIKFVNTTNNDVNEVYETLGIEAARQVLLNEINEVLD